MTDLHPIPTRPAIVKITPEMAADWLENRNLEGNRRLSEHIAGKYARDITEGRWMTTHQGIAFDREGWLIDGQHRLRAVVLADASIEMFVVPNCDNATFAVLDNGFKRQAAHLISAPHAKTIAAAAKFLAVVAPDRRRATGSVCETSLSTAETIEIVNEWPELAMLAPVVESCYTAVKLSRAPHLAVLAQASRTRYAERIEDWADGVRSGVSMDSTDPRLALRNRWVRDGRFLNGAAGRNVAYRMIVRAWNAYAEGRPIAKLQAVEDRPAPAVSA